MLRLELAQTHVNWKFIQLFRSIDVIVHKYAFSFIGSEPIIIFNMYDQTIDRGIDNY